MRESCRREAKVTHLVSERADIQIFCLHCVQLLPPAHTASHTAFGELCQPLKNGTPSTTLWSVIATQIIPSGCALTMCQTLYQVLYLYKPQSYNSSASSESLTPFTEGETEARMAQGPWTKTRHLVNAGVCLHTQISLTPKHIQFLHAILPPFRTKSLWIIFCYNWGAGALKQIVDES